MNSSGENRLLSKFLRCFADKFFKNFEKIIVILESAKFGNLFYRTLSLCQHTAGMLNAALIN